MVDVHRIELWTPSMSTWGLSPISLYHALSAGFSKFHNYAVFSTH